MDFFADIAREIAREIELDRWNDLSKEDQLAQIPSLCDENIRHEYQSICDDIRDDGYNLAADVNAFFKNKNVPSEEIESDWDQLMAHIEDLKAFHVEFLRRYERVRHG